MVLTQIDIPEDINIELKVSRVRRRMKDKEELILQILSDFVEEENGRS